jgi:mRNA-degrading endonuclease RelE of RelBE toxin-antitoxin system
MPYAIDFEKDAWQELRELRKGDQVRMLKAVENHLTYEPTRESKSRIKQLREGTEPPYRLRVDEFRVFYDVNDDDKIVTVYGIVDKDDALEWLAAFASKMAGKSGVL